MRFASLSFCFYYSGCEAARCCSSWHVPCSSWDSRSLLGVSSKTMGYGSWRFGKFSFIGNIILVFHLYTFMSLTKISDLYMFLLLRENDIGYALVWLRYGYMGIIRSPSTHLLMTCRKLTFNWYILSGFFAWLSFFLVLPSKISYAYYLTLSLWLSKCTCTSYIIREIYMLALLCWVDSWRGRWCCYLHGWRHILCVW